MKLISDKYPFYIEDAKGQKYYISINILKASIYDLKTGQILFQMKKNNEEN